MIIAMFIRMGGTYQSFSVSGHAMPPERDSEFDLICSAVSSATFLTCNTLTDYIGGCLIQQQEKNELVLSVEDDSETIQSVIRAFHDHMREMAKQYPGNIQIIGG